MHKLVGYLRGLRLPDDPSERSLSCGPTTAGIYLGEHSTWGKMTNY
ncbi:MAG: hypothetical protein ACI9TH_003993 [Kiritimatiellia bacterium]|jgi:hypothetical protein